MEHPIFNWEVQVRVLRCQFVNKFWSNFITKQVYYERFSKEALIQLAMLQEQELIKLEAICVEVRYDVL